MRNKKGDGEPYYQRYLEKEKELTPEEKEEHEKWWSETSKKFKVIGEEREDGEE